MAGDKTYYYVEMEVNKDPALLCPFSDQRSDIYTERDKANEAFLFVVNSVADAMAPVFPIYSVDKGIDVVDEVELRGANGWVADVRLMCVETEGRTLH